MNKIYAARNNRFEAHWATKVLQNGKWQGKNISFWRNTISGHSQCFMPLNSTYQAVGTPKRSCKKIETQRLVHRASHFASPLPRTHKHTARAPQWSWWKHIKLSTHSDTLYEHNTHVHKELTWGRDTKALQASTQNLCCCTMGTVHYYWAFVDKAPEKKKSVRHWTTTSDPKHESTIDISFAISTSEVDRFKIPFQRKFHAKKSNLRRNSIQKSWNQLFRFHSRRTFMQK